LNHLCLLNGYAISLHKNHMQPSAEIRRLFRAFLHDFMFSG
jgi:hypothetical protein